MSGREWEGGRARGRDRAWDTVRITSACTACGLCLLTCPEGALRRAPRRPAVLDAACTACWLCIEVCPTGAIVEAAATAEAHPSTVDR